MIVSIHQPNFFPRLKTLQKISLSDVWVVLDNVQYCQREFQNRTFIVPEKGGNSFWCSLPIHLSNGRSTSINDVKFACDQPHKIVENVFNYHFNSSADILQENGHIISELMQNDSDFVKFVVSSCTAMLSIAGFSPKIIYASDLNCKETDRTGRLVSICQEINADTYLADSGGARYIDEAKFKNGGIELLWHVWETPSNPLFSLSDIELRNGSSLNILERSLHYYIDLISQCKVSRLRHYAEGK